MRTTLSKSRMFSLRAPIVTEAERALFQRRVALSLIVVLVLGLGFFVVANGWIAVIAPDKLAAVLTLRSSYVHVATVAVSFIFWLVVRSGKRSSLTLDLLDAISIFGICLGWTLMMSGVREHGFRPETVSVLACTYTLVVRAALIPSTPARTAVLGLASFAPLIPVTREMYAGGAPDASPLSPEIFVAIWSLVGTAATTVISHVIYGLQLEVRKAMQLGQYLLEDKIGEGGMGTVFRASHALLRRPAAIKLLTGKAGHAVERFEREVQITARLTHPNTVAVFDYGHTPDGAFYYAMEYLDGVTLEDLVTDFGGQSPTRVVHILLQVCGALEEAHAHGLVHRDIKPANIMLTERGGIPDFVKVLDFGLVKESTEVDPGVSTANVILGTPHYMAPEAIVGPSSVDARTDLYALGATAYFLLTGEHVFDGANLVEVCSQHLHQAPPSPSAKRKDVPAPLERIILDCLAKNADERPRDAEALAEQLRACALPEWTRADARAWWAAHPRVKPARGKTGSTGKSGFGDTIAVALEERA